LSDVSPTLLAIMNIPQPKEMTGKSLIKLMEDNKAAVIGK
jgi:bisphosphoglycerate-independent phosphoglycerate mutase (AlkP superfamily)